MFKERLSDNSFLAKSKTFVSPEDGTVDCIYVPKGAFLEAIWLEVVDPSTGDTNDSSITVGFKGNGEDAVVDEFIADGDGTTAAVTAGTAGKYFTQSGAITATVAANTSDVNAIFRVFARFTQI